MSIFVINQATKKIPSIGTLKLDTTIDESHNHSNTITDHPIESGFSVSDAIIHNPMSLSITGIISTHSLYPDRMNDGNSPYRADSAYSKLVQLSNADALVTVVSTLKTYTNMGIESISVPRNSGIGQALEFSITFKKVRVVDASAIQIEQLTGNDTALLVSESDNPEHALSDFDTPDNTRVYIEEYLTNAHVSDYSLKALTERAERIRISQQFESFEDYELIADFKFKPTRIRKDREFTEGFEHLSRESEDPFIVRNNRDSNISDAGNVKIDRLNTIGEGKNYAND
jgi:hypothetical protein